MPEKKKTIEFDLPDAFRLFRALEEISRSESGSAYVAAHCMGPYRALKEFTQDREEPC